MSQVFKLYSIYTHKTNVSSSILFIYFWLHWVFAAVPGLSPFGASGGDSRCSGQTSHAGGFSLQSTGSRGGGFSNGSERAQWLWLRDTGTAVEMHRLSCFEACGLFLDQGSSLCPLLCQEDSHLLHDQGSLLHLLTTKDCINIFFFKFLCIIHWAYKMLGPFLLNCYQTKFFPSYAYYIYLMYMPDFPITTVNLQLVT